MRSSVVGVVGSIGERQYSQRGVVKRSYHVDEAVSSLDVRLHCRHDVRLAADSNECRVCRIVLEEGNGDGVTIRMERGQHIRVLEVSDVDDVPGNNVVENNLGEHLRGEIEKVLQAHAQHVGHVFKREIGRSQDGSCRFRARDGLDEVGLLRCVHDIDKDTQLRLRLGDLMCRVCGWDIDVWDRKGGYQYQSVSSFRHT